MAGGYIKINFRSIILVITYADSNANSFRLLFLQKILLGVRFCPILILVLLVLHNQQPEWP